MLEPKKRLEQLRKSIKAENISFSELAELQSLAEFIDENDVELLEWAGVPEDVDGEFSEIIREKLSDEEFWEQARSWMDGDFVAEIMEGWDREAKIEFILDYKKGGGKNVN